MVLCQAKSKASFLMIQQASQNSNFPPPPFFINLFLFPLAFSQSYVLDSLFV